VARKRSEGRTARKEKESQMEAVVVLALLVALGALVFGPGFGGGDGFRPQAVCDIARPAGSGPRSHGRASRRFLLWRASAQAEPSVPPPCCVSGRPQPAETAASGKGGRS
jgi:hypothetical protein